MIIKQVIISAFGKIKDLSIDLSSGLNIIYGKNEAGKSTTQAFIKAMFYGFNSNKQAIRDNDRKRYMPWDFNRMSGQLTIEDDKNIEYLIKRSFAQTKKGDSANVINAISGIEAKNISSSEPGADIFGLGCEAFEKTLFIKQLGCKVSRDNEDEIMTKLSNISQSGDEEVSFHKSKEALDKAKKSITNVRKNGKLDLQKNKVYELTQERSEVLRINDEIINNQIKLNDYKAKLDSIKSEIENLDETKKTSQNVKLYKDYCEIKGCAETISKSQNALSDLVKDLIIDDKVIGQEYIDKLKEKYGEYLNFKKSCLEIEGQIKEASDNLKNVARKKDSYIGFEGLEEDIEQKILIYQSDIKSYEKSETDLNNQKNELKQSEERLSKEKETLGELICFEGIDKQTEQSITSKEERLRELELKLENNSKQDNARLRLEILKDKKSTASIMIGVGSILTLGGIVLGFTVGPALFTVLLAAIPCLIYGIYSLSNINKRLVESEKEMASFKDAEGIKNEISSLKSELGNTYKSFTAGSYKEYNEKLKKYYESKTGLDVINALIKEKKSKITDIEQLINVDDTNKKRNFINSTFSACSSTGFEDFAQKLKDFERIKADMRNLEYSIENLNKRLKEVNNNAEGMEKAILNLLSDESTMDKVPGKLELLVKNLEEYKKLENTIKTSNLLYNSLLKGRSIDELERQLDGFTPNGTDEIVAAIEDTDLMIKEKNSDIIDGQKLISDLENSIKTKLVGRRTVDEIEVELENTNEKILYYENALKSIENALSFLEDSFEEIRKNFGPKLNAKVGEILSEITLGKYHNVKIADNYEIKVEDNGLNMIKELDYFSNGTLDQIYFALRLGIIDLIYGDQNTVPIILDDTFVQYDDGRLKSVLDYLYSISDKKQVILFTCQKRELEMLNQYTNVNIINF